jgi:hypothetical protein
LFKHLNKVPILGKFIGLFSNILGPLAWAVTGFQAFTWAMVLIYY